MKYEWILIKREDGKYLGWSHSVDKPACGEPDLLEWVEWNKSLPEDIDEKEYTLKELQKLDLLLEEGENK